MNTIVCKFDFSKFKPPNETSELLNDEIAPPFEIALLLWNNTSETLQKADGNFLCIK